MHPISKRAAAAVAIVLVLIAPTAFAQFSPGPNPITGTTGAQTLSSGTGTVEGSGTITTSGGTNSVTMTGTSNLVNNGRILQTGTGRAIDSNSGTADLTINNSGLISSVSTDAFRVNTSGTSVSLINSGVISVSAGGQAIDWAAITTGNNRLMNEANGTITAVGEDAVRPGVNGHVTNFGTISATPTGGASPSGSDGIDIRTLAGIHVNNYGTISGRHGIATDGSATASTITLNNYAGGTVSATNGSGLNIDGFGSSATVVNAAGGTIRGGVTAGVTAGDGDGIDVDGTLVLLNSGDVLGFGAIGAGNNAEGIAAGGGSITNEAGGRIIGSSLAADAPNGSASAGANGILIDNSDGGNAVAATTITNRGLIEGRASAGGATGSGIRIIGTFADSITNDTDGEIRGTGTTATIQTGGGADTVTNRGAIVGSGGFAVDLQDGDDAMRIEGGAASIVGNVSGGSGSNALTIAPGDGNAFIYDGSFLNFAAVAVESGTVLLSGVSEYTGTTTISGGALELDGAGRLSSTSSLALAGGSLRMLNADGADAQAFASLALLSDSLIDLGLSSLTFADLGAVAAGAILSVQGWSDTTSPLYAFRFASDLTSDADFLTLIAGTTINGFAAGFAFAGGYTNVLPTPLPAALPLLLSGLGVLAFVRRRRKS